MREFDFFDDEAGLAFLHEQRSMVVTPKGIENAEGGLGTPQLPP